MRQKLKTIFINLLIIAIPIIFIGIVIYIYRADDIVQVQSQTYIEEPLTVTENHIQISNLKASYETFDESNIYGELIMLYQLSNGEEYQDQFSLEQIHNKQLPDNGSVLTKTYYKGTYVLRSGKTVTLETTDKLKKGRQHPSPRRPTISVDSNHAPHRTYQHKRSSALCRVQRKNTYDALPR